MAYFTAKPQHQIDSEKAARIAKTIAKTEAEEEAFKLAIAKRKKERAADLKAKHTKILKRQQRIHWEKREKEIRAEARALNRRHRNANQQSEFIEAEKGIIGFKQSTRMDNMKVGPKALVRDRFINK